MRIHHELYRQLYQLVPGLDALPVSKDPLLLEKEGATPVNFHVLDRQAGQTTVTLCCYPRSPSGELVANPDVKIQLDHATKTATPTHYVDLTGATPLPGAQRAAETAQALAIDSKVYQWLSALKREGFKAEGKEEGRRK